VCLCSVANRVFSICLTTTLAYNNAPPCADDLTTLNNILVTFNDPESSLGQMSTLKPEQHEHPCQLVCGDVTSSRRGRPRYLVIAIYSLRPFAEVMLIVRV
jgi:hypothetical protein